MNKLIKISSIAISCAILTACGNLSEVNKFGATEKPVFPQIASSTFNHDGSGFGSWPNWDNVRQIERGMNKDQLQNLIGRPHFAEGWYGVREWDYVFNYRENGEHKICQYKILFDKSYNAQNFYWYPNGCNGNASFNLNGDFLFDFDKDFLTEKGKSVVAELARKLLAMNVQEIRVEGHTDRMGSEAYNLDLSQRRAETVANELKSLGVLAQMKVVGFGKSHQIKHCVGNDQEAKECLRPNRRVEIHASGNRMTAEQRVKKAGKVGPSALYDTQYPYNPDVNGNPYPKIPAQNLQ